MPNSLDGKCYDVVIVGAGPSGGQCARELSGMGYKVAVIEKRPDLVSNNFSSAAAPLSILSEFSLPGHIVASYWNKIRISSGSDSFLWSSPGSLGIVMDFAALRSFLAEKACSAGCVYHMGTRFTDFVRAEDDLIRVHADSYSAGRMELLTRVMVDATGHLKAVMAAHGRCVPASLTGAGAEMLIEAKEPVSPHDELVFFLGEQWVPGGYGWIFPMGGNVYKIGAAAFRNNERPRTDLKLSIQFILNKLIHGSEYSILDVHGGLMKFTDSFADQYFAGNVIAIGDAISCINPLGGEGIRHGMYSARVAASHIDSFLKKRQMSFQGYQNEVKSHFGLRWKASSFIAKRVFMEMSDERIASALRGFSHISTEDLMRVLFDYEFGCLLKEKFVSDFLSRHIKDLFLRFKSS